MKIGRGRMLSLTGENAIGNVRSWLAGALQQFHTRASQAWAVVTQLDHNFLLSSEDTSVASWGKSSGAVVNGVFISDTSNNIHRLSSDWAGSIYLGAQVTVRGRLKSFGARYVYVNTGAALNAAALIDLQAGTGIANGASLSGFVCGFAADGSGDVEFSYQGVQTGAGATMFVQHNITAGAITDNTFAPNGTDGFKVVYAQVQITVPGGCYGKTTGTATAPYSFQTFAANVLRVLPSPAGVMAALREPQSTNYIQNTTVIAGNGDGTSTMVAGVATGFDGTLSVSRFTPGTPGGTVTAATGNNFNRWWVEPPGSNFNGPWTHSIWVKQDAQAGNFSLFVVDRATDNIIGSSTVVLTGAWQRVTASVANSVGATAGVRYVLASQYACLVQLPQQEPLPFATQPIPTSVGAVTRQADVIAMAQNPTMPGSLFIDYWDGAPNGSYMRAWAINVVDSGFNRFSVRATDLAGAAYPSLCVGNGTANATLIPEFVSRERNKVAAAVGPSGCSVARGGLLATDPTVWVPAGLTGIAIGDGGFCGYIHDVRVYKSRLTDAQLQALST